MDSTQPISAQDLQTITALIPLSPGETIADTQRFGGTAFVSTINRVAGWAAQYVFEEGQGWQLKGTGLSPISSFPFHYVHVPSSLSKEDVKQIIEAVPKSAYGDVLRITAPSNGVVRVASGIGQFFGPFSEL